MIIELFGMPGSGKSTYISRLNGRGAVQPGFGRSGIRSLLKKLLLLSPYSIHKWVKLKAIIPLSNEASRYSDYRCREYAERLILLAAVYHYSRKSVYIDEGIVHRIITLVLNYDLPSEVLVPLTEVFAELLPRVRIIYLDVPVQECLKRIRQRGRKACALDFIPEEELRSYLEKYYLLASQWMDRYSCTKEPDQGQG